MPTKKKKKQIVINIPILPRIQVVYVVIIILIITNITAGYLYFQSNEQYKTNIDKLQDKMYDDLFLLHSMFNFIRPNSTTDQVYLVMTDDYLYISHTEQISLLNKTGYNFRVPKDEEGRYLLEDIEVMGEING